MATQDIIHSYNFKLLFTRKIFQDQEARKKPLVLVDHSVLQYFALLLLSRGF
jgi:hypothetical protein